jgi:hypothetical protein
MSPLAGALLGAWQDDNSLQFCTYKLYLLNIEVRVVFGGRTGVAGKNKLQVDRSGVCGTANRLAMYGTPMG